MKNPEFQIGDAPVIHASDLLNVDGPVKLTPKDIEAALYAEFLIEDVFHAGV